MTTDIPDLFAGEAPFDEYEEGVRDLGAGICPRCRSVALSTPLGANAWSRTSRGEGDVPVYVCSPCGSDEADEDWQLPGGATPQSDWPVAPRDSSPPSRLDPDLDELSRYRAAIRDLRNSGSGIWQMMGGRAPEPDRSDPFKPEGEWVSLAEDLWTVEPSEINWWAGHAHPTVRRIVASHEICPPELIHQLAGDTFVEIRQAALANTSVDAETLRRRATDEPVDWLRKALGDGDPAVVGRCGRCGGRVKRPDRFLTCSINCSLNQAKERVADGTYARGYYSWPWEYLWEVADSQAPGGVPGSGPKFRSVRISFVPGLNAAEATAAVVGLSEREDLDLSQAITAIDQMAQTMDGPSILEAFRIDRT